MKALKEVNLEMSKKTIIEIGADNIHILSKLVKDLSIKNEKLKICIGVYNENITPDKIEKIQRQINSLLTVKEFYETIIIKCD